MDACERYLKYQPAGDKWVEVAYKSANLYYRHNQFAEANAHFTRIALEHPSHELAKYFGIESLIPSTNLPMTAISRSSLFLK